MKLLNHKKSALIRDPSAVNPRLSLPCRPASPRGEQAGAKPSQFFTKKKTIGLGFLIAIIVLTASYFIFYSQTQESQAAEWYNENWHYRQQFDVFNNSSTEDLIDFQVAIPTSTLGLSTLLTNNKLKSDYTDLRFTDKNGTLLNYWFGANTSTLNNVYIKIASLPKAATSTIFMYYGNPSATDSRSGKNTFLFFDDFSDSAFTNANWTNVAQPGSSCTYSQSAGVIQVNSASNHECVKLAPSVGVNDYTVEAQTQHVTSLGSSMGLIVRADTSGNLYHQELDETRLNLYRFITWTTIAGLGNNGNNLSISADVWYQVRFKIGATSLNAYSYTHNTSTSATDANFTSGRAGVQTYGNNAKFDDFLIRKWAQTDPTINATAGTAEEIGGGPVGYWKFDEGYGTTAYDSSGSRNNGTLISMSVSGTSTAWVDGKVGKALKFNSNNGYVNVPDNSALNFGTSTFSLSFWLKAPAQGSYKKLVIKGNPLCDACPPGYAVWLTPTAVAFSLDGSTEVGDIDSVTYSASSLQDNKWHLITAVRRSDALYLYFDAALKKTGTNNLRNVNVSAALTFSEGDQLSGFMDEIKIFNYPITVSQIKNEYNSGKAVAFGSDQSNKTQGLVGYWKMDESTSTWDGAGDTVFDSSGNGYHATSSGNAKATTTATYGNAGEFDGTDDYLTISTTATLAAKRQITISAWVRADDFDLSGCIYCENTSSIGNTRLGLYISTAGKAQVVYRDSSQDPDGTATSILSNTTLSAATWYFISATYDADNDIQRVYINGILDIEARNVINPLGTSATADIRIGDLSGSNEFDGLIDEVKVYTTARTPDQIMQDYLEGPTPIAYYSFNEGGGTVLKDRSGQGNNGTITAGAGGWVNGKYGPAYDFDGAATTISTTQTANTNFSSGFSISTWIRPDSRGEGGYGIIVDKSSAANGLGGFSLWMGATNNIGFMIKDTSQVRYTANNAITYGRWYHVIITVSSNATVTYYINGVVSGTPGAASALTNIYTSNALTIGNRANATDQTFDGLIDDLKIYNYALTPWQIAQEYNQGKPMAQWSFDEGQGTTANNTYATSTGALAGTLTNMSVTGTSTAWTTGKMGQALKFDGINDYITVANNSVFDFAGKDVSISLWFKASASQTGGPNMMLNHFTGGAPGNGWYFSLESNKLYFENRANTNTIVMQTTETYNDNKWHYATVVISNAFSKAYLYVDNILKKTDTFVSLTDYTGALTMGGQTGNYRFTGLIDEIKIYPYVLSPAQIRQDYNDGLAVNLGIDSQAPAEGLVAWWKMDESTSTWDGAGDTVFDFSGNGNNGTSTGDAKATTTAMYGNAGEFDGTGDYVNCGETNSQMIFGRRSHTYEAWINAASLPQSYNYVVATGNDGTGQQSGLAVNSAGKLALSAYSSPLVVFTSATPTIAVGNWYHVAMVYDGTYANIYINGTFQQKQAIALNTTIGKCRIGAGVGNQTPWTGQIDDVKIYNLIRTPDQIMQDYLQGPSPIAYYSFNEGAGTVLNDRSGQGNTGTITPGAGSWVTGKIGPAYDFDGSGTWVNGGTSSILQPTGLITVSAWVKADATNGSYDMILGNTNGDTLGVGYYMYLNSNTIRFGVNDYNNGTAYKAFTDTTSWHHVIGTYDKANIRIYVDGVEGTSDSLVSNIGYAGAVGLGLGASSFSANEYKFNGKIDEVKVYNYVLTPWQMAQEYNGGKPVGYWKMDDKEGNTVRDYSGNNYYGTLSLSGSPATSSAWQASSNCKLNGCLDFDGSNDYVNFGNLTTMDFGTNNFSVSAWIKSEGTSASDQNIITKDDDTDSPRIFWGLKMDDSNATNKGFFIAYNNGSYDIVYTSRALAGDNTWHHLVGVRDSSYLYMYLDGVLQGKVSNSGYSVTNANVPVWIGAGKSGAGSNIPFNGKIDEVKIFNYTLSPTQIRNDYNMGKGIFFK